ncbi:photosynthetic complex putative assembly protein PuhB [Limnohabitans sp. Rim8]|uniref:photosynthetic complex putative assembly protein PuhB n=1 Tax=Limnohabitans sp. Rim8 TaxID=1100718 RepID=UPI0033062901
MAIENLGHEHEFEPQFGLPERLPSDEFIVWQGAPDVAALAYSAFHFKKLALYFAVLIAACAWPALEEGAGFTAVLLAIKWIVPLAIIAMATVWMLAYFTVRTTVYTITNKRVVMRLGIVLTVSFNLPLMQLASADVRVLQNGYGDITLALKGADRIGWVHLWPSVRPWRIAKPEPTLRAVPDVQMVAAKLRDAWTHNTGLAANAVEVTGASPNARLEGSFLQVSAT